MAALPRIREHGAINTEPITASSTENTSKADRLILSEFPSTNSTVTATVTHTQTVTVTFGNQTIIQTVTSTSTQLIQLPQQPAYLPLVIIAVLIGAMAALAVFKRKKPQ